MHLIGDDFFVFLNSDNQVLGFFDKTIVIEFNNVYKLSIELNLANYGVEKQVHIWQ
jgi:hypothetical protein